MPKISGLIPVQSIADDDEVALRDVSASSTRRMSLGALRAWLQTIAAWIKSSMIDYSTMSLNMRIAYNTTQITPVSPQAQNNAAQGLSFTFTAASACTAMLQCSVAINSTADFEFYPLLFVNGVEVKRMIATAAPGFAGNRATQRTVKHVVSLAAGTYTISGGQFVSSGSSMGVPAGAAFVDAIILGNVTA